MLDEVILDRPIKMIQQKDDDPVADIKVAYFEKQFVNMAEKILVMKL